MKTEKNFQRNEILIFFLFSGESLWDDVDVEMPDVETNMFS